jgi:large subunit ribosomal protein L9
MKVILKRDVKGLGREGDLKEVKDGYARNHLIPTGAAVLADLGAVRNWERHRDQREERDRALHADAEATAQRIGELTVQVGVKAGEKDRLFGSVTSRDIADKLRDNGIEIDRHDIHLREPIKTVGEHQVRVHVMAGVEAQLRVEVVPEH